jgi:hypothetical protein
VKISGLASGLYGKKFGAEPSLTPSVHQIYLLGVDIARRARNINLLRKYCSEKLGYIHTEEEYTNQAAKDDGKSVHVLSKNWLKCRLISEWFGLAKESPS